MSSEDIYDMCMYFNLNGQEVPRLFRWGEDVTHGYCSKCHHKLKYVKYIDNVFYGCSKCDNFVKVKHSVIKENKYE